MTVDTRLDIDSGLSGLDKAAWFEQLEDVADDLGHYNFLGKVHSSAFIEAGPRLLVTFEAAPDIIANNPDAEPLGFHYVRHEGWSHLGLYAGTTSWFRDPYVYAYFDRLIDDGFFDNFDDVLFYGADAGGYAAAAYSVAAPGARVLAICPQATLDPRITGFDQRHRTHRRQNFHDRYGYAPDMIDGATQAYVAFDPYHTLDAVHAALFTKPHVMPLRCVGLGSSIAQGFKAMDIADDVMRGAMDGALSDVTFGKIMRARRGYRPYLRNLYHKMINRDRPRMAANVCTVAIRNGHESFFKTQLADLQAQGHMPYTPIEIRAAE